MKNLITPLILSLVVSIFTGAPADAARGVFPTRQYFKSHLSYHLKDQPKLLYFGGPVLSNAQVYAVFWGKNVDPTVEAQIGDFYSSALNSTYDDYLIKTIPCFKVNKGGETVQDTISRAQDLDLLLAYLHFHRLDGGVFTDAYRSRHKFDDQRTVRTRVMPAAGPFPQFYFRKYSQASDFYLLILSHNQLKVS